MEAEDLKGRGRIFLSYSRDDKEKAIDLRQALRAEGIPVWWDEDLLTGTEWFNRIDSVLSKVDAVVVLWSERSVDSAWVAYEASVGRFRKNLAHVRLDGCMVPKPFESIQMEDLSRWDGREGHREFQNLLRAIRVIRRRRVVNRLGKWLATGGIILLALVLGYLAHFLSQSRENPAPLSVGLPPASVTSQEPAELPVEVTFFDKEASRNLERILVPSFSSTVINTGGATDGHYLDGLADLFASKFSAIHPAESLQLRLDRPPGIRAALNDIPGRLWQFRKVGIALGRILAYQDERPDIGQKATVSVILTLYDSNEKQLWTASKTLSVSTPNPIGDPPLGGIKAIDLATRIFAEIAEAVQKQEI